MGGIINMKTLKIFKAEKSAIHQNKWIITIDHDNFYCKSTIGSYHVLEARVMGLSYANYLRMCRDIYHAEVIGKGSLYPVAYFTYCSDASEVVRQLNIRATAIVWNKEHPDNKVEVK
jgi:hypothetical protein